MYLKQQMEVFPIGHATYKEHIRGNMDITSDPPQKTVNITTIEVI